MRRRRSFFSNLDSAWLSCLANSGSRCAVLVMVLGEHSTAMAAVRRLQPLLSSLRRILRFCSSRAWGGRCGRSRFGGRTVLGWWVGLTWSGLLGSGSFERGGFSMYWGFLSKVRDLGVSVRAVVPLCSDVGRIRKHWPPDGVVFEKDARRRAYWSGVRCQVSGNRGQELVNMEMILPISRVLGGGDGRREPLMSADCRLCIATKK